MGDKTTPAGSTPGASTRAPSGGSETIIPEKSAKGSAGSYDQSHVWIVHLVILFMWLIYATPIIKKFFKRKSVRLNKKKVKTSSVSPP